MLKLNRISKNFGKLSALKEVDMEFEENGLNAIIGPNGAGKTTLINVITGVFREDSGTITLNGTKINSYSPHMRTRLGINRTFQIPKPFMNLTVAENVKIGAIFSGKGKKEEAEEEVERIMKKLGLAQFAEKLAVDLNTEQRKLVDLGRALSGRPKYLFLDEMGAGLAEGEILALSNLIKDIQRDEGISIIYIGHVMKLVKQLGGPITVFSEGTPILKGDYDEVTSNDEIIKLYLGERYAKSQ